MRLFVVLVGYAVALQAQGDKPAPDWSAIDRQLDTLRAAVEGRDINAARKSSDDLLRAISTEYQKQVPSAADYLRQSEERAAANPRFRPVALPSLAALAAQAADWNKARAYALEALATESPVYDTVHLANNVLGLVALHNGDVASAETHLLAAGRTKGTSRMKRWGPTMALAKELLDKGRNDVVLEYLQLCRNFVTENPKLDVWIATLKGGRAPDLFGVYLWEQ